MLSDAGHTLTDIFALGLAWFAAGQAERPSDDRKTYGYHRVGILVALLNAISLILIAIFIGWEAIQRFQHPEPVQPLIMFVSAAIGIVINLYIGFGLSKEGDNLNMRAAALHVFGDVGAAVAVILAGGIILLTGWTFVDPLLSVGIALFIAFGAWGIIRETTDILLESVPKDISVKQLAEDIKTIDGVNDVHDLHVWCIASGMSSLSCHVSICNLEPEENARVLTNIQTMLQSTYNISHATIQCECREHASACCENESLYCRLGSNSVEEACCDHEHQPISITTNNSHKHS
ncbi:cation diffusion facilitator family transporter [Dictyobacter kobayashii]|uniref:Zinc transporter ZitB n=1 Tax=Dictyobacter kobayashii TaxID=2014872 RepID=A0A402ADJ3_9CHLR|nr:cation diffusion facilitator family transporter [Dictyobacter kobayashii]GCE17165.1 zinc transporter ZitB [Dictyobacter kobayashii]